MWEVKNTCGISMGWKSFKMHGGGWLGRVLWGNGRVQMDRQSHSRLSLGYSTGTDALLCVVPTLCPKIVL